MAISIFIFVQFFLLPFLLKIPQLFGIPNSPCSPPACSSSSPPSRHKILKPQRGAGFPVVFHVLKRSTDVELVLGFFFPAQNLREREREKRVRKKLLESLFYSLLVADISFVSVCVCVCVLSHVWLFVHSMDCSLPDPLSMGFSRQEYWSGLPCPPPRNLPDPGIEPKSPALAGRFFTTVPPEKPWSVSCICSPVEHNSGASWICVSQVIVLSLAQI